MASKSFEVGDLVWAKMKGYPYWPGQIIDPPAPVTPKAKKCHHYVLFFGDNNHAWIPDKFILLHNEKLVAKFATKNRKRSLFKQAVDKIVSESSKSSDIPKNVKRKVPQKKMARKPIKHESRFEKLTSKDVTLKVSRKRPSANHDEDEDGFSPSLKVARSKDDNFKAYATPFANIRPNIENTHPTLKKLLSRKSYDLTECPPTPPIELSSEKEILKTKNSQPSASKKTGLIARIFSRIHRFGSTLWNGWK